MGKNTEARPNKTVGIGGGEWDKEYLAHGFLEEKEEKSSC